MVFFPGSTIGNFAPAQAVELMSRMRLFAGAGGLFIVGADLIKSEEVLVAAYNDAAGVTARFNLNLLDRINRELGGDFEVSAFRHRAVWNTMESRMEAHLQSQSAASVRVGGESYDFYPGETIHTENSYKYTLESFTALARLAGWRVARHWVSPAPEFAVFVLESA